MMMMMSSAGSRRALARPTAFRNFSSTLLVPLQTKTVAPAEIEHCNISEHAHAQLQEQYTAFNEQCKAELQEMNKNIIENIVARGGTEGWDTDIYALTRKFEFDSFEECQAFIMRVAKDAELKDHHPEWSTADGGRSVNVKLTSHFAQNTVTRLDFELAECMNTAYTEVRGSFKMYPRLTAEQWSSVRIGLGMFVLGTFFFKFVTGTNYEQRDIAPGPMPSTEHTSPVGQFSPVQALADISAKEEALDYAYGEYEKRDGERPIPGV